MKVWLVILQGQGDTDIRVVDEETFKWVTSDDPGRPAHAGSSWIDTLVPASQLAKMHEEGIAEVRLTNGSWQNDRMLACMPLDSYDHLGTALKAIRVQGNEVEDTVDGYIY